MWQTVDGQFRRYKIMQPILYIAEVQNIDLNLAKVRPLLGENVSLEIENDRQVAVNIMRKRLRLPMFRPTPRKLGSLGQIDSRLIAPFIAEKKNLRARIVSVHFQHSSHQEYQSVFISVWGNSRESIERPRHHIFSSSKINQQIY